MAARGFQGRRGMSNDDILILFFSLFFSAVREEVNSWSCKTIIACLG